MRINATTRVIAYLRVANNISIIRIAAIIIGLCVIESLIVPTWPFY